MAQERELCLCLCLCHRQRPVAIMCGGQVLFSYCRIIWTQIKLAERQARRLHLMAARMDKLVRLARRLAAASCPGGRRLLVAARAPV